MLKICKFVPQSKSMELHPLKSISPIDGRYHSKTKLLSEYFSEYGLIKYRVEVEIEYFIALCALPIKQLNKFPKNKLDAVRKIYKEFSLEDAKEIKEIEKKINHDVKAVEYFIKNKFNHLKLDKFKEFIHFGLTSQDINNTAIPYSIKESYKQVYLPEIKSLIKNLKKLVNKWKKVPMIARTHGQVASPTILGKEIYVFVERIEEQIKLIDSIRFKAKFSGATGNFNAHYVAFPNIDWEKFSDELCKKRFGLERQHTTTQIEHYDHLAGLMQNLTRINTILIDLCRDVWSYISIDYFQQKIKDEEVGSSAMPHKVNPIDFENAEGNLAVANTIFNFLAAKLPISRMQRDLTDSTVLRNIGVPFSHTIISTLSLKRGLKKLLLNNDAIKKDLENNWIVVAEAIQTILRREGYENPYETMKQLTRKNKKITSKEIKEFINKLTIKEEIKEEISKITPFNYTGIFRK